MFKVNNKDTKATPMEEIFKSQVKTFREPCQNKRVQHIVLFCFTRLFFFFLQFRAYNWIYPLLESL